MNILAIDTTTKKAQALVKFDGNVVYNSIDNEITHSEKLLPLIDNLLRVNNIFLNNIDCFICTLGPGSFTGVRIGIATIKAMAKTLDKKIYGVTSLELLAAQAVDELTISPKYVLSLMDARNLRAYYNLFKIENGKLIDTKICGNDYIQAIERKILENNIEDVVYVVDNESLKENLSHDSVVGKVDLNNVFSSFINLREFDYLSLDAMYYRKSEAERTKDGE